MEKIVAFLIILYWVVSSGYLIRWHYKQGNLSYGTIFISILSGPALAILVRASEKETYNNSSNRWMRLRDSVSTRGFHSLPPPPLISKKKNFKFFQK
jgi:hypothetical protein